MTNPSQSVNRTAMSDNVDKHSQTARQQQLINWLQHTFANRAFTLDSLPGDASSRQYHRLQLACANPVNKQTSLQTGECEYYIVMDSADEQDAMTQFINVTNLMAPNVNVPTLMAQEVSKGFLVLQDFGSVEFAHLVNDATPKQVNEHYQLAMRTLIDLQQLSTDTAKNQHQLPDYDQALLNREMDLFSDWFVPYINVTLDLAVWSNFKAVLIEAILAQPQVVVHRDYHSRNLMQDQADHRRLGVIDFQDAVIGAYSYDLVSLVRDAYVQWPESQVSDWINDFWRLQQQAGLTTANTAEMFEHDVNIMGIQRHLKVLGIFIRLSVRDGKDRYLADIPKVMQDLLFELEWLTTYQSSAVQPAISAFSQWLNETVLPAYQSKFVQQYI